MARVVRIDNGTTGSVERTPEGGLRVAANFTRVGVLPYSDGEKSWAELRPADEVFAADSLATLRGRPVTDMHPAERRVTADNWKKLSVGHVGDDVGHDDTFVNGHVRIEDADAVKSVDAGARRDLSCGYDCELDPTPGEFNGERYDAVQRNIRYNHVAVLPPGKGRAGSEVSLRLDGAAIEVPRPEGATVHRADAAQGNAMKTIKIKGKEYRVDDDAGLAQAQGAADAGASAEDKLNAALATSEDALKKALSELAGLKAAMDAKGKDATQGDDDGDVDEDDVPDDVMDSLLELRATHQRVVGKPVAKGTKASEVRKAIIAKIAPATKLDSMDAVQVKGMYTGIVAGLALNGKRTRNDALAKTGAAAAGIDANGKAIGQADPTHTDEADPVAAAQRAQQRSQDAWKKPTSYGRRTT